MAETARHELPAARGLHFAVALVVLAPEDALCLVVVRWPQFLRALPAGSRRWDNLLLGNDPTTAIRERSEVDSVT